ncbi:hypothetical protein FBD94_04705 [Pedobacter hiemivivus]|uniref:Fibronectin type-III domain-containing protein n=1 Tax=Pedobacter hiemivivus TaxID=2530454 RepID=A0A4V5PD81_9SPHI|nr:hypothetical protein [Pedobacter hiemivivus]TKC63656.1 hypothetical protein FBD94_04705 [Pedobacter hiemivivus]
MKNLLKIKLLLFFLALIFIINSCKKNKTESPVVEEGGALTLTTVDTEYFGTNVSVKIQVAGTAKMREWGICWSINQNPTTSNGKNTGTILPGTTNMSTSVLATPIEPCVKYYVRAYAITTTGQTYYGNQLDFKATGILNDCHPFNGFWQNSAATIVFKGNFEHFEFYSITPTAKPEYGWRNALDRNLISIGSSYIYNLVKKTTNTWGCTVLWTKSNPGATLTEEVKPAANSTLTLSSDEKSVTISSTSPFGTGPGTAVLYKKP